MKTADCPLSLLVPCCLCTRCWLLLEPGRACSALDSLVCCAGVIPFVVATLKQREDLARTAIHILQLLCAPALDPHNHHAALLSRLQGVRRLSEVFSPRHQQARGTGMAISYMLCDGQMISAVNQAGLLLKDLNSEKELKA